MPPIARNENGLSRVLHSFNDSWQAICALGSFGCLESGQDFVKVVDCLVLLTGLSEVFATYKFLGDAGAWWH